MIVTNRQGQALPAKINLNEFGQAMSQLNLSSVPPHMRQRAVMDHLMMVMASTITDRSKANEIITSRLLHARNR